MRDVRIEETCSCGASISVTGGGYRRDSNPANPRSAEEIAERWRQEHHHQVEPGLASKENNLGSPTRDCGRGPCSLGDGHEGDCRC